MTAIPRYQRVRPIRSRPSLDERRGKSNRDRPRPIVRFFAIRLASQGHGDAPPRTLRPLASVRQLGRMRSARLIEGAAAGAGSHQRPIDPPAARTHKQQDQQETRTQ